MFLFCNLVDVDRQETSAVLNKKEKLPAATRLRVNATIVMAARSETLLSLHNRLNARLYRIRYQSNLKNETWGSALAEHDHILEALENRDAERLSALLRQHLKSTWEKVSEFM